MQMLYEETYSNGLFSDEDEIKSMREAIAAQARESYGLAVFVRIVYLPHEVQFQVFPKIRQEEPLEEEEGQGQAEEPKRLFTETLTCTLGGDGTLYIVNTSGSITLLAQEWDKLATFVQKNRT